MSLATKPTADATFGLGCLVLHSLVELVNSFVELGAGLLFVLLGFCLGVGERRLAICHLRTVRINVLGRKIEVHTALSNWLPAL